MREKWEALFTVPTHFRRNAAVNSPPRLDGDRLMRYASTLAGMVALCGMAVLPASAQDLERYRLERTENGYVRLDTQTGAITLCRETDGRLACAPAVQGSERETLSATEAESLRERLRILEGRISALESGSGAPVAGLPPEEEFERGIGYMERFFRMFMGLVKEFEDDTPRNAPEKPAPERT
jgi:hypothetical protein